MVSHVTRQQSTDMLLGGLDTVIPDDCDRDVFAYLEQRLRTHRLRLVDPDGQEDALPEEVRDTLRKFARLLKEENAVVVSGVDKDLTTQQAALFLGVSRPTVVKLLDDGEIPYTRPGKHRRIRLNDLNEYRERVYRERKQAVTELTRMSEEMGGYDLSPEEIDAFRSA